MSPSVSNPTSPRRSSHPSSSHRASTGPRSLSPSPSSSTSSTPYPEENYPFNSPSAIQISRTVSVTVEVSSSSAPASHMDVSQYNMPVTTCYSPTSSASCEYQATTSGYETTTSYTSQDTYPYTPSGTSGTSSSYYGQFSADGTIGSSGYAYDSSELHSVSSSRYQQRDTAPTHTFSRIKPSRLSMLDRFSVVDSREDALAVEARAAIREGRVADENTFPPGIYGWESVIDSL